MDKIKIRKVEHDLHKQRGFDDSGCLGCLDCKDTCCSEGADVDKVSHELIFKNREHVEGVVGAKVEDCFDGNWLGDAEYPGGDAIGSKVKDGFCAFKLRNGKGCALFKLVHEKGLSARMVPAICRTYPVTWAGGVLKLDEWKHERCNLSLIHI